MTSEYRDLEQERRRTFVGVMKLLGYSSAAIAVALLLMWIFLI